MDKSSVIVTGKVYIFSDSVFCTHPGALDPASACTIWDKTAAYVTRSNSCKNREDIDIDWHVCLGDASVQLLQTQKAFVYAPESFPDRIIFASLFNCDSRKE